VTGRSDDPAQGGINRTDAAQPRINHALQHRIQYDALVLQSKLDVEDGLYPYLEDQR
jgi:hypothetical protein